MASTTLEEKINKIRQKNEEIRRRHEEVEADKQNAAKLNALVKMAPSTDWPERKEPPEFSNPPPPRSNGNSKPKVSTREYRGQQQQYHAAGGDGKKTHIFAEGDGPPPDPTYNFLADSEREERTREDSRDNERFRGRGGSSRGSSRKRGGGREGFSLDYRGPPGQKDASKPDYEAWRAERNRIDEARINRQRTAEGNWRREWDNNKINVEQDEAGATKLVHSDIGDVRKDHKEFDKWQVHGNDHDSYRGRGGKQFVGRGAQRGSHNNRVYQHSNSFDQFHALVPLPATKPPPSPNGIDERMVVATDKSIKVIVNHGNTTVPKGPVMSVKVSSASIAGTGRVGPRQKPRILYSSQSETESSSHEHEKFSGHKSPDDKSNRVSFIHRDTEEQHRYVPKSPHPQRKGDNNSKSPYLTRKEFKYDSQQQRHGENELKSPYLQRNDIKDSPKSPHFQKKTDFTNRDSHIKQKNNNSMNDSSKSNHSQKRTSEKIKQDSQKYSGPKKLEDGSISKPQRMNKRTDKSKNFQHNNSKEIQESNSNESNSQPKILDTSTSEQSAKNIANSHESLNQIDNTKDNCEKNIYKNSEDIEIVKENKNENNDISKLSIDSETLSSKSTDADKVYGSISDDTKSIDHSEPTALIIEDANESSESMKISNNETDKALTTVSNNDTQKELIVQNVGGDVAAEFSKSTNALNNEVEKDLIVHNVESNIAAESPEFTDIRIDETEKESNVQNVEINKAAESLETTNIPNDETEKVSIVQNVEISMVGESTISVSGESKTDEYSRDDKDIESGKDLPEIINEVQEKIEIETIDNNTHNSMNEITNLQDVPDGKTEHEELLHDQEDSNLEKLDGKTASITNELQSEEGGISVEPEKIVNATEQVPNVIQATNILEKVDLAHVDAHQSGTDQVSNNLNEEIVKEPENEVKLVT